MAAASCIPACKAALRIGIPACRVALDRAAHSSTAGCGYRRRCDFDRVYGIRLLAPSRFNTPTMSDTLTALDTPALILDMDKAERNVARLTKHLTRLGVTLRPHVKTAKSIDVVRRLFGDQRGPITVSTVKEAEYFADGGFTDITYAVGIAPDKIARVVALCERGADVKVVHRHSRSSTGAGGRRVSCRENAGCADRDRLRRASRRTRAGRSKSGEDRKHPARRFARSARRADPCRRIVRLSQWRGVGRGRGGRARRRGRCGRTPTRTRSMLVRIVSVGSTPTAHFARDLAGVTEVRAGVFMFFDLVMHGIGVCEIDDIALSVLATVIGHKREKGWILVDGGWMALSRDRGTARHPIDQGYGVVCDVDGRPYPDLIVSDASQEHGIISVRPGSGRRCRSLRSAHESASCRITRARPARSTTSTT